jgi:hypothetical protein
MAKEDYTNLFAISQCWNFETFIFRLLKARDGGGFPFAIKKKPLGSFHS